MSTSLQSETCRSVVQWATMLIDRSGRGRRRRRWREERTVVVGLAEGRDVGGDVVGGADRAELDPPVVGGGGDAVPWRRRGRRGRRGTAPTGPKFCRGRVLGDERGDGLPRGVPVVVDRHGGVDHSFELPVGAASGERVAHGGRAGELGEDDAVGAPTGGGQRLRPAHSSEYRLGSDGTTSSARRGARRHVHRRRCRRREVADGGDDLGERRDGSGRAPICSIQPARRARSRPEATGASRAIVPAPSPVVDSCGGREDADADGERRASEGRGEGDSAV